MCWGDGHSMTQIQLFSGDGQTLLGQWVSIDFLLCKLQHYILVDISHIIYRYILLSQIPIKGHHQIPITRAQNPYESWP